MAVLYRITGRKFYQLLFDIVLIIASYLISYVFRFYPFLEMEIGFLSITYFLIIVLSYITSFYLMQIYRIMWTYSNISDVYKLITANIIGFVLFTSSLGLLKFAYSRIVVVFCFLLVAISTILYRIMLRDYYSRKRRNSSYLDNLINSNKSPVNEKRILIVGAGEAGRTILSEYTKMGLEKKIIGFIDDDPHKIKKIFNGKTIFSSTKEVNSIITKYRINEIIIALPSADAQIINRIVMQVKRDNQTIPIKTVPPIRELVNNEHLTISLRNISLADLIGREEFKIDDNLIKNKFSGKTILITGAGGSIGSEICRQLLKFNVKKIICLGRGEHSIYTLAKVLNDYIEFMDPKPEIIYRIVDVKNKSLLEKTFDEYMPNIVFHAAAHKHVPLMEFNEVEAIQNNVVGTWNVLELCTTYKTDEFVLISTDKAVNPANIMGATKRLGEIFTSYFNQYRGLKTVIVRFGNVLGSRGSVIPLFKEQIEKGGPVTVTHPEITRYFMSIPEASLLVINAVAFSRGREIFVLDMGMQYRILDIAKKLIELYGYRPDDDIKIQFTGLRPGEKMFEELFYDRDSMMKTENQKIFRITSESNGIDEEMILKFINVDMPGIVDLNPTEIRQLLNRLIPGYVYTDVYTDLESCSRLVN